MRVVAAVIVVVSGVACGSEANDVGDNTGGALAAVTSSADHLRPTTSIGDIDNSTASTMSPTEPSEPERPTSTEPVSASTTSFGHLTLHVSNQSFADDPVGITISIADQVVVEDDFYVEGQHNWITFELEVPSGEQQVTMTSSTGVEHSAIVNVPPNEQRWAVADYWYYPPDPQYQSAGQTARSFTFTVDDEPIYFD